MFIRNRADAEKRERNGLTSQFMFGLGDVPDAPLSITWVTVEPGARQIPHHHPEAQVYVIIRGNGIMQVGEEQKVVGVGDLIYIPPDTLHGIENLTNELVIYISAATPAFDLREAYDRGQLTSDQFE